MTELTAGDSGRLFTIAPQISVAALICWENLFSHLARESVNGGAQLLVQLTNDVWFGPTAAPRQHNLMSVMRAVENRVPVVIASNAGPSQLIDGYGRVVAATSNVFQESAITGAVALGGRRHRLLQDRGLVRSAHARRCILHVCPPEAGTPESICEPELVPLDQGRPRIPCDRFHAWTKQARPGTDDSGGVTIRD
ncbi:MAG: nitrilase-related carbon-nitrogen hydrolase [Nitrospiraceae bacterium]